MGGKTRIKSQTMQFAMLKIQCTNHSGLRMSGCQSADVFGPKTPVHTNTIQVALEVLGNSAFGSWCWHEANSLSVLIYPDLACQLALTKTILHKTANTVNCFGQAAFKPFSRSAAYEAANACGFTKGITLQVPLM